MSTVSGSFREGLLRLYNGYTKAAEGDAEGDGWVDFHFGKSSNQALSDKLSGLQVDGNCHVLDLCCGWGGAAQHIAGRFGCRVTGVDINPRSVARARKLAKATPVRKLLTFAQADARDLPLDSETVDVVWSQVAFCHIPNRSRLLRECFRVLRPSGHLVFEDILKGEYLHPKELEALSDAWFYPGLETAESYRTLLKEAGFELLSYGDVGREYVVGDEIARIKNGDPAFLQDAARRSSEAETEGAPHGPVYYLADLGIQQMRLYLAQGKLRIGSFVCAKRKLPKRRTSPASRSPRAKRRG